MERINAQCPVTIDGFDFVEESGGIFEYRLASNGLQVLLLPQPVVPVVAFMVTYRVGSRNEVTGLTGATHMLEHLMFKGTEKFNRKLNNSVFNVLQSVGAQVNATTWYDRTNYYELLPKDYLPLAIEIEADRMRGALINEEDLESERTVILNEFDRGKNDPVRNLYDSVWSTAFVAHPYHHPTIGWRSDIENATVKGLRHFYDTYYRPDNATVSVLGDFEPEASLELIRQHFGGITNPSEPIPDVTTREPEQNGERRVTVRQAGQVGSLMLAFKSPPGLDRDVEALDVLAMVLSTGKNSRLFSRLTDKGLTTNVGATASRLRDPGLFYLFAFLTPGTEHEIVEEEIWNALEEIKDKGITEAELRRAKNQLRAQEIFGRDGVFAVASQLNEAIAAGDWKLYTAYLDRIAAVDVESVQRVAKTYCVRDRSTVGRYIPS